MKTIKRCFSVFCKLLTKYFLFWCPDDRIKDCSCRECSEKDLEQYYKFYNRTTRWSF